eukprot:UN04326
MSNCIASKTNEFAVSLWFGSFVEVKQYYIFNTQSTKSVQSYHVTEISTSRNFSGLYFIA